MSILLRIQYATRFHCVSGSVPSFAIKLRNSTNAIDTCDSTEKRTPEKVPETMPQFGLWLEVIFRTIFCLSDSDWVLENQWPFYEFYVPKKKVPL